MVAYTQIRFRVTVAALVVIIVGINQVQSVQVVQVSFLDNPKLTYKNKKFTSPQPSPSIEDEGWGKNNFTSQEEKFIERLGR